jgi:N,N'-diacetyllegionaminate synthase
MLQITNAGLEIRLVKLNNMKTFIIAEAGVNHNGSIELAKQLIDVAVNAGADAVKFQTFKAEKLLSKSAKKADYQKETTSGNESQFEMIKKLELDLASHHILIDYCKIKGILFLSTPFDLESIDLLDKLGINIFKIPSGEITNLPYLEKIAKLNKQIILSTGMSNLGDIEKALEVLTFYGTDINKIIILHANTEYPTPMEDVNLRAMITIGKAFNVKYGYSDHTKGIEVPIAAVALGASVIEKHFTLDKTMEGPDHKASLEPIELENMVHSIRNIEKALGNGIKQISASEQKNIKIARKSIVASRNIEAGEILTEDNLCIKRPGNGISPMRWYEILGSKAVKSYKEDDLI